MLDRLRWPRPMRPALPVTLTCRLRSSLLALVVALTALLMAAPAFAGATRTVTFRGYRVTVPAGWPVVHLDSDPRACVRFDRHAVYVGTPGATALCPTAAVGRTEAILVSPLRATSAAALTPAPGADEAQIADRSHGVLVTATWHHDPAVVRRALGVRSLAAAAAASARAARPSRVAAANARMHAFARSRATSPTPAAISTAGEIYTGSGFDACNTPSQSQMNAWGASPYRGIGVYIGGANMACSQPNLNSTWVTAQSDAGWHLIPIYVGLQAPVNSCGCAAMSTNPTTAESQGTAAAQDAVVDAQTVGMGPGNPLYVDMEAYTRSASTTAAVLAFLSGWTTELHASGYGSGVYSSDGSGIYDLVSQYGTGYAEPDELWMANWNGAQNTSDSTVPTTEWANHQRLHQYRGAHNESHGGTTINIDGDYLDSATAAAGTGSGSYTAPTPAPQPALTVKAGPSGSVTLNPSWRYASGVTSYQAIGGTSPSAMTWAGPTAKAGKAITTANQFAYYAVEAFGSAGQLLGTSAAVPTPAHVTIFGQGIFTPQRGLAGVPVGCFGTSSCTLRTTVTSGRTTLASTGPEPVGGAGGLAFFKLTSTAQRLLEHAPHHQLAVRVKVANAAGGSVTRTMKLNAFSTQNPSPKRSLRPSSQLRLIGASDFVSNGWVGGILAACTGSAPCQTTLALHYGRKVIATARRATLGTGELGYLFFSLTPAGHQLLMHAHGNQLGVSVSVTTAAAPGASTPAATSGGGATGVGTSTSTAAAQTTATGRIVLIAY